jgi:hypothetical protein
VTYAPITPVQEEDSWRTQDVCVAELAKHVDRLGEGDYGFRFSEPDGPIAICRDPEDDETIYVNNHPLSALALPFPVKTIYLANLTELGRLSPRVDQVSYHGTPCVGTAPTKITAAFKYWFIFNDMAATWMELNVLIRLPRDYPNIVRTLHDGGLSAPKFGSYSRIRLC